MFIITIIIRSSWLFDNQLIDINRRGPDGAQLPAEGPGHGEGRARLLMITV